MNEGRASAYGKEIRAKALPFKEEEIMRSLTYWNTAKYTSMCKKCTYLAISILETVIISNGIP